MFFIKDKTSGMMMSPPTKDSITIARAPIVCEDVRSSGALIFLAIYLEVAFFSTVSSFRVSAMRFASCSSVSGGKIDVLLQGQLHLLPLDSGGENKM